MADGQNLSRPSHNTTSSPRRRALDAVGAFFDAVDASHQTVLNSTKPLEEQIAEIGRNCAAERQHNSERLRLLEETINALKDAPSRSNDRQTPGPPDEHRHLEEERECSPNREELEAARSTREEIAILQREMTKLRRENEDLKSKLRKPTDSEVSASASHRTPQRLSTMMKTEQTMVEIGEDMTREDSTGPQPKVQPEGVQGKQIEPLHIDIIDLTMEHTPTLEKQINENIKREYTSPTLEPGPSQHSIRLAHMSFPLYKLKVADDIKNFRFRIPDLSKICGGSSTGIIMKISEARKIKHGHSRFLCLDGTQNLNPFAPRLPGAHGSLFSCRDEDHWPNTDGTLECVIGKYSANKWGVFGLYECKKSNTLTGEEFLSLPEEVREGWIALAIKRSTIWSLFITVAIFLRRESRRRNAGRGDDWTDPTDDEITKCLDDRWRDSDELLEDVFVNLHVTDQEIRDALESGEERLNVFSMRCVGFDTALVEFIMAEHSKLPAFQKEPGLMARTRKRRATTSSSSGNVHLCGPRRKKQRFNGQTDFDSDDDDGSEYDASTKSNSLSISLLE